MSASVSRSPPNSDQFCSSGASADSFRQSTSCRRTGMKAIMRTAVCILLLASVCTARQPRSQTAFERIRRRLQQAVTSGAPTPFPQPQLAAGSPYVPGRTARVHNPHQLCFRLQRCLKVWVQVQVYRQPADGAEHTTEPFLGNWPAGQAVCRRCWLLFWIYGKQLA